MAINFGDGTITDTAPTFGQPAILSYESSGGSFQGYFGRAGYSGQADRLTLSINTYRDPYGILTNYSNNKFRVNTTGTYMTTSWISGHSWEHYFPPYLWGNSEFARRPNASFTNSQAYSLVQPSYTSSDDSHCDVFNIYHLATGTDYYVKYSGENSGGLSTGTGFLQPGYQGGGTSQLVHVHWRMTLALMEAV